MTVSSIFGGEIPTGETGEPNESLISFLEDLLERARSGNSVGVIATELHNDRSASWHVVGQVGGFTMLGAATVALDELTSVVRGE